MAGPAVSGEVAWSVSATARQDRWLSKTEPGLQTRLQENRLAETRAGFPANAKWACEMRKWLVE